MKKCDVCPFMVRGVGCTVSPCNYQPKSAPVKSEADFIPCLSCGKLILRNKQRCPFCQSTLIFQQRNQFAPNSEVLPGETVIKPSSEELLMNNPDNNNYERDLVANVRRIQDAHTRWACDERARIARQEIAEALKVIMNNTPLNDTRELLNKIASLIVKLGGK